MAEVYDCKNRPYNFRHTFAADVCICMACNCTISHYISWHKHKINLIGVIEWWVVCNRSAKSSQVTSITCWLCFSHFLMLSISPVLFLCYRVDTNIYTQNITKRNTQWKGIYPLCVNDSLWYLCLWSTGSFEGTHQQLSYSHTGTHTISKLVWPTHCWSFIPKKIIVNKSITKYNI